MNKKMYVLQMLFLSTFFIGFGAANPAKMPLKVVQQKKISKRLFEEETWGLSENPMQLYDLVMACDDKPRSPKPSLPIIHKIVFENAINCGLSDNVLQLMQKHSHLCEKHSIGRALWSIYGNKASCIDLDKQEFSLVSAERVFFVAQELAIEAHNKDFLESCLLKIRTDYEIRKIIFPHHYNVEDFDIFLYRYVQLIVNRGIPININRLFPN